MSEKPMADNHGAPVAERWDPSANVLALVEAAGMRQDDLRASADKYLESEIRRVNSELGCIKEIAVLRARHDRELRKSESKRLASTRKVDLGNFDGTVGELRAALKEQGTIQTSTATTLQARVDATAQTLAKAGSDQVGEVMKRIAALELAAAQGIGKQQVADPQMEKLAAAVDALSKIGDRREGKSAGVSMVWVALSVGVGMVGTIIATGIALYALLKP